jgi:nucleotide-binding universal stress UspA family protein
MVNFMVAVDLSENARNAFYAALSLMQKSTDMLYIIHVVEPVHPYVGITFTDLSLYEILQEQSKAAGRAILTTFRLLCHAQKINCRCILGISNHVGELICHQVDLKKIEFLIVGRRGMGPIKRMFIGSTSKYLVEHANCDVLIVKGQMGPAEIHSDLSKVIALEEAERKRRIELTEETSDSKTLNKFHSELDRNIAIVAEESERVARIQEQKERVAHGEPERKTAIQQVVEEEERKKKPQPLMSEGNSNSRGENVVNQEVETFEKTF